MPSLLSRSEAFSPLPCFTSCDSDTLLLVEKWLLWFQPFHQETGLSGQLWVMSTSEPTAVGVRSRSGR